MSLIVMKNNPAEDGPVIPPEHENNTPYPYCMYFNGLAEVAFADTTIELYDALFTKYSQMTEEEKTASRIRLAAAVAAQTQAEILIDVDPNKLTKEEWDTLTAPRNLPQPFVELWSNPVPLVVYETAYQPYTNVPKPASALNGNSDADNLWMIRNADEDDFLVSLHEVGYIRLMENDLEDF